jgi:hypothetical protein
MVEMFHSMYPLAAGDSWLVAEVHAYTVAAVLRAPLSQAPGSMCRCP